MPTPVRPRVTIRCACLGRDVISGSSFADIFMFKEYCPNARVDVLLRCLLLGNRGIHSHSDYFVEHMKIHNTLQGLSKPYALSDIYIIDTWSDYVHQKFMIEGEGFFCSNYCDLSESGKRLANGRGRLNVAYIYNLYATFVDIVRLGNPQAIFIFICFNAKYDPRNVFKERSHSINSSLSLLCARRKGVHCVDIENSFVTLTGEGYPYHYSSNTLKHYIDKFDNALGPLFC
jgi:hypothetical protein